MILGNKLDLFKQPMNKETIEKFDKDRIINRQVSALSNKGVQEAFAELVKGIMPSAKSAELKS